jgi:hypothetical protein
MEKLESTKLRPEFSVVSLEKAKNAQNKFK